MAAWRFAVSPADNRDGASRLCLKLLPAAMPYRRPCSLTAVRHDGVTHDADDGGQMRGCTGGLAAGWHAGNTDRQQQSDLDLLELV